MQVVLKSAGIHLQVNADTAEELLKTHTAVLFVDERIIT